MAMKKKKKKGDAPKLELTPMIDVVFQLLIFFVVTLTEEDINAHLDVFRPAPEQTRPPDEKVEDLVTILVYNQRTLGGEGYSLEGRKVRLAELDRTLSRLASVSTSVSIVIKCTNDSPHQNLVKVLDICAKSGLKNLSVFSM